MIRELKLTNFRSHVSTEIPLQPITLFVGPVSSGKSNVLRALVLIQNSIRYSLLEMFPPGLGEFRLVRSRWAGETDPIGYEVVLAPLRESPAVLARYRLRIGDSPHGLFVVEETLERQNDGQPWEWVFQRRFKSRPEMGEFGRVEADDPTVLHKVRQGGEGLLVEAPAVQFARSVAHFLSRIGYFHLEVSELKSLGSGQATDRLGYYGNRMPDFFAWAKSSEEGQPIFQQILAEMREIVPDLDTILVTRVGPDQQGLALSFKDQAGFIAAPDLSDGTLLTLGLLCLVYGPRKPAVLCLEEPESGLHPRRMRWIFDRLLGLAYPPPGQPPVQILLTTHSPYLVDLFSDMPESVLIAEQQKGRSRITPLESIRTKLRITDRPSSIGHEWAAGLYEGL